MKALAFILGISLTGCVTLYKPNIIHSPLLKSKGEFNSTAAIGISGSGLFNLQSAYAPADHFGLAIDGMYHYRRSGSSDATEKLNILSGELGLGYFNLNESKTTLFQVYAGSGIVSTSDRFVTNTQGVPEVHSKYYNIFVQPGIDFIRPGFEFSIDTRINYLHLYNVHAYRYDEFEWWNTDFRFANDTSISFVNIEPAFTLKAGTGKAKIFFQAGLTLSVVNTDTYFLTNNSSYLGIPLFKFSLGLSYYFK